MSVTENNRPTAPSDRDKTMMNMSRQTQRTETPQTQVGLFLADTRTRYEGIRRTLAQPETTARFTKNADHIARANAGFAMVEFFRASIDDALDAEKLDPKELKKLKKMKDVAAAIAAGQEAKPQDLKTTRAYISKQLNEWDKHFTDAVSADEKLVADQNILLFKSFLDRLHNPIDEAKDAKDINAIETYANVHEVNKETNQVEMKKTPPEIPPFTFHLDHAKPLIEKVASKDDPASAEDIASFFAAVKEDLEEQEAQYKKETPEWKVSVPIIQAAEAFQNDHEKEIEPGKIIFVTKEPDGTLRAGWKPAASNVPGSDYFTFDPSTGLSDEISLNRFSRMAGQFQEIQYRLENATAIIEKLQSNELLTQEERVLLTQQIENYTLEGQSTYLPDIPEDAPEIPAEFVEAQKKMITYVASVTVHDEEDVKNQEVDGDEDEDDEEYYAKTFSLI